MKNVWLNWSEASNRYAKFADKHHKYKETSKVAAKKANLEQGQTIVDLGCGTGTTTREILKLVGNSSKIIAIDSSSEMIDIARSKINDKNVEFIYENAENLENKVNYADRVISNSAFYQFDNIPKTLDGIKKILSHHGVFIFNVPMHYFEFEDKQEYKRSFIVPEVREIAKDRDIDIKFAIKNPIKYNRKSIEKLLDEHDFKIIDYYEHMFYESLEEARDMIKIPTQDSVPLDLRDSIIDEAYQNLKDRGINGRKVRWAYFITKHK